MRCLYHIFTLYVNKCRGRNLVAVIRWCVKVERGRMLKEKTKVSASASVALTVIITKLFPTATRCRGLLAINDSI